MKKTLLALGLVGTVALGSAGLGVSFNSSAEKTEENITPSVPDAAVEEAADREAAVKRMADKDPEILEIVSPEVIVKEGQEAYAVMANFMPIGGGKSLAYFEFKFAIDSDDQHGGKTVSYQITNEKGAVVKTGETFLKIDMDWNVNYDKSLLITHSTVDDMIDVAEFENGIYSINFEYKTEHMTYTASDKIEVRDGKPRGMN